MHNGGYKRRRFSDTARKRLSIASATVGLAFSPRSGTVHLIILSLPRLFFCSPRTMTCPLRTCRVLRRERVRTRLVLHIPRMNSSRDALRVIFATPSLPPLRLRPRASFSERRTRRMYKTAGVYLDIFFLLGCDCDSRRKEMVIGDGAACVIYAFLFNGEERERIARGVNALSCTLKD